MFWFIGWVLTAGAHFRRLVWAQMAVETREFGVILMMLMYFPMLVIFCFIFCFTFLLYFIFCYFSCVFAARLWCFQNCFPISNFLVVQTCWFVCVSVYNASKIYFGIIIQHFVLLLFLFFDICRSVVKSLEMRQRWRSTN